MRSGRPQPSADAPTIGGGAQGEAVAGAELAPDRACNQARPSRHLVVNRSLMAGGLAKRHFAAIDACRVKPGQWGSGQRRPDHAVASAQCWHFRPCVRACRQRPGPDVQFPRGVRRQPERLRQSGPSLKDCPPAPALPPIPIRPARDRRAGLWRIGHEFARRRIEPRLGRRVWQDRVLGSGRLGQYPVGPGSRRDRESRAVSSKNATVRPVSMPGLATCLPARAAVATNISPRFKAVKKKPEVLAKAKIQLGRSAGPVND